VLLAYEFLDGARPHPRCQGLRFAPIRLVNLTKKVDGRTPESVIVLLRIALAKPGMSLGFFSRPAPLYLPPMKSGLSILSKLANASQQHPRACLAALALLFAIQISSYWYPTPDASGYLSIARSLAHGEMPSNLGSGQIYLAPGYPVIISPAFLIADMPFLAISLIHWVLVLMLMGGIYVWLHRRIPDAAVLVTALAMLNVDLWALFRRTLSEMAFMALLMWTINALHWALDETSAGKLPIKTILAALGAMSLALTRQAGIMVVAGLGLMMVVEVYNGKLPSRRALATMLTVGVPPLLAILGVILYDRLMAAPSGAATYVDQIIDPAASTSGQVLEGLRLRISEIGRLTIPGMFKSYARRGEWLNGNMVVFLLVFALVLAGWWRLLRRTGDLLALAFPFYFGLYVIWPFDQATRFTVPMIPLVMACAWLALDSMYRYRHRIFTALALAHGCVAVGYWLAIDIPRVHEDHRQWPAVQEMALAIRAEFGPVLGCELPQNTLWMLQFALDRPVHEHQRDKPIDGSVDWIITPAQYPVEDGFNLYLLAGNYQLLRRTGSLSEAKKAVAKK
jgi:hypothetical protein